MNLVLAADPVMSDDPRLVTGEEFEKLTAWMDNSNFELLSGIPMSAGGRLTRTCSGWPCDFGADAREGQLMPRWPPRR